MRFFRWVLAVAGFMQRGPVFFRIWYAFIGYWIGSVIDNFLNSLFNGRKSDSTYRSRYSDPGASQKELIHALMTVFAHLIHADGRIMHSEMEYVRQFLRTQFSGTWEKEGEEIILQIFRQKKAMPSPQWERQVAIQCQLLAMYLPSSQRVQLIQLLIQMARVDGSISPVEIQTLRFIASYLGLGSSIVDRLMGGGSYSSSYTSTSASSLEEAYRTLDIPPSAKDDEVRKAYRKLALKYHPDKVAQQDEAAREAAAAQFSKITEAKDRIFAARGLK